MALRTLLRLVLLAMCFTLVLQQAAAAPRSQSPPLSSQLTISDNPSAVVIKVGDQTAVNLTVVGGAALGQVCFGEEGFPSSGFTLTFLPQCASMQESTTGAQLIVEATPAAAPQNFTALIVATVSNETASALLTVTVVPAIPAWIPWLGILLFFLVIGAALFIKPRKPKGKAKIDG